ncbi:sulfur carrier protein ThiS [Ideonella sp. YS5]|uniref:sulfur carrier protein ThiS n=1 Tax=Ideonella sp. YS5 TaxID=3453714 RepID=UPI003EEFE89D
MTDPNDADILLNGVPVDQAEGLSLAELLARLGEPPDAVATALNGSFVARDRRGEHRLARGDRINLFKAIVGG